MADKTSKNKYTVDILEEAPVVFRGFCPIEPVPKGRPRFARRGKFVQTYTPKKTEDYENAVRAWMQKEYGILRQPMDGFIKAKYEFILPRPKSKSKKVLFSNTKPDVDNFVKSFQDGLDFKRKDHDVELGVIANDSRVSCVSCSKRYANEGEIPGTFFEFSSALISVAICSPLLSTEAIDLLDPSLIKIPLENISSYAVYCGEASLVYLVLKNENKEAIDEIIRVIKNNFPALKKIIIVRF